ncbi:hypothetical protein QTP88_012446 [Uroleucon formosanum]
MNQDGDLGEFWSNSICLRKLTETKVINYIDLCLENYKRASILYTAFGVGGWGGCDVDGGACSAVQDKQDGRAEQTTAAHKAVKPQRLQPFRIIGTPGSSYLVPLHPSYHPRPTLPRRVRFRSDTLSRLQSYSPWPSPIILNYEGSSEL